MIDASVVRPIIDLSCSEAEWQELKAETDRQAARVQLPTGWQEQSVPRSSFFYGGRHYLRADGASVLFTVGRQDDGKRWLHVSIVVPEGLPTYEDLCELKRIFVGQKRQAIQVFPPRSKHVNIHDRCLHLWACLDGDGLPDFGKAGTI